MAGKYSKGDKGTAATATSKGGKGKGKGKGAPAASKGGKRVVAKPGAYVQRYRANYAHADHAAVHADAASKVTWLVESNPKRPGSASHVRFAKYFGASTVAEYIAKGGTRGDLRWEAQHGFLSVAAPKGSK